jgi:hypothetical protein
MIRIFLYNKSLNMAACHSFDESDLTQVTFIKVYLSWRRIRHDDPYRYSKKVRQSR